MAIHPGRFGASIEGDFVVFLIGVRVNRPLKLRRWLPVFIAMPRMLKELEKDPDAGLLHYVQGFTTAGPVTIQYWRSFEHLERYARNPDAKHLPAWKRFNQAVRGSGDVGIWHETYRVRAGEYEAIYGNMPRIGLAKAGELAPLGSTSTAAARLAVRPDDRAPVPGY
jgi:hypothetical protein